MSGIGPITVLKPDDQQRLHLDLAKCHINIAKIKAAQGLADKLRRYFPKMYSLMQAKIPTPTLPFTAAGFFADADKQKWRKLGIRHLSS